MSFVTVKITDQNGLTVPRSHNPVKFTLSGPGDIIATDNGDATSFTAFQSPDRAAFNALALAIVRTRAGERGKLVLGPPARAGVRPR